MREQNPPLQLPLYKEGKGGLGGGGDKKFNQSFAFSDDLQKACVGGKATTQAQRLSRSEAQKFGNERIINHNAQKASLSLGGKHCPNGHPLHFETKMPGYMLCCAICNRFQEKALYCSTCNYCRCSESCKGRDDPPEQNDHENDQRKRERRDKSEEKFDMTSKRPRGEISGSSRRPLSSRRGSGGGGGDGGSDGSESHG